MFVRYKKVSSLCLGTPTAVSWSFGYEDYGECRVFADKFDSVFTEFRNKWKIGGRLFRELPRTIESCKAGCLFFTGFNECMHLTVKLDTVPINLIKSMKLNKSDVHIYMAWRWSTWLFPHHPPFHLRLSNWDCWRSSHISINYGRFCDYPPIHSYF